MKKKLIKIVLSYNIGISIDQITPAKAVLMFTHVERRRKTTADINETPNVKAFKQARSYFK